MTLSLVGWQKDAPDPRDWSFASAPARIFGSSPTSGGKVIPERTPVSNQLNLSSCVANATVDALEVLRGLSNPDDVRQLSRLFVYYNSRNYHAATRSDTGTYIRNAFKSLSDFGVCPEDEWPYDVSQVYMQPTLLCYRTATDNKLTGFYRIEEAGSPRSEAIIRAIEANHPVVFGAAVNPDLAYAGKETVRIPTSTKGAHAMIITGWRRDPDFAFYVRNSWGSGWGDGTGHCWIEAPYVESADLCDDFWVPTVVPLQEF